MKAILMSIKPKWVEKIASGEKTIEVRKSVPKCGTPFKVYMYATKTGERIFTKGDRVFEIARNLTGKVVGEFVCDKIYDMFPFGMGSGVELNGRLVSSEEFCGMACLTEKEIEDYIGIKDGYGLHISDLKIYDKPRELSEFWRPCPFKTEDQDNDCIQCDAAADSDTGFVCTNRVWKAPQSWCYVEEL